MDGIPLQIIDIEKDEKTQKSTYNFKFDALQRILSEVNDIEVAVISIAGQSRHGKSFLLSYLLRYLSNSTEINWIGKNDEPLKGFEWNHGIEPQTKGIWIWSKPLIVKQSVSKEIAIIVMDTQGVYDEYTDMRDWSTIVGITLLTSSCFIFNVLSDIQENVLTQLETFVSYGLMAMERDEANKHAFQKLLFLIRDWIHARDFNYGHSGGKKYINRKLSIKSNQSQTSKRTRQLIYKCFEDVTCFLMPEPGAQRDEHDFDGSVDKLSPNFITILKELFSVLLNPDSLKPKVINGNTITGRDLIKYFEVFDGIFNGDELPQPMDLVEAVAKATDLNLIYKLKETYVSEMNKELQTKLFLSSNEIEILNISIKNNINNSFEASRKSQNNDNAKQVMQTFDTELKNAYKRIYLDNEERREKTANDTIAKCIIIYSENMDKFMNENNFVKTRIFDKQSIESTNLANKYFTDIFGVEEIDSYAPYLLKINKSIEETENLFKIENKKRKKESKIIKLYIEDSLTLYREKIMLLLEGKDFLTPEIFTKYEIEIESQALEYFANKRSGDQDFIGKFNDLMAHNLNDTKSELRAINHTKMKETIANIEEQLSLALNYCKEQLNEILKLFSGSEDPNQISTAIKNNTIKKFQHESNVKDSNILSPYTEKLEAEIDKILAQFSNDFKIKIEDLNDFCKNTIEEAMNRCFGEIKPAFEGKNLHSKEQSITFTENLIRDVIEKYKNVPKYGKFNEIKDYLNERTASAADLLLINKLIKFYSEKMNEILLTKTFFSREELSQIHNEKSEKLINTFKSHIKTSNSQLIKEFIVKLSDDLKSIFVEFNSQNEQNREKYVEEEINKSFCLYEECMAQKLDHICIESNKFDELNTESKNKALKQLMDVCGEENELNELYISKFSKLIETAENKFISENNMKLSEAKRKISEAVNKSLDYYSDQMNSALNENMFHSNESFKRYENNLRDEAYKRFTYNCKYGEIEFITQFELDLNNKIDLFKSKFKSDFRKKMEVLESQIIVKINESLSQYNGVMYHLLDAMRSEQQFSSKHEELKLNVINQFKQKCLLKDNEYRDLQISKLEKAINDSHNEFHDRLLNQMKKSEIFFEKSVNDSIASYSELMKVSLNGTPLTSEEELESLHQNVMKNILNEFEKIFQHKEDFSLIESNRRALEIKIINEFQSIKKANSIRNEEIREKTANDTIAKCISIYNESMKEFMTKNNFLKTFLFDKQSIKSTNLANKHFTEIFGAENTDSYASYSLKIHKLIQETENKLKIENHRRKSECKKINKQAVGGSLTLYRKQFESILNEKVFLTPEQFSQYEHEILSQAVEYFKKKCSGGQEFFKKFDDLMNLRLNVTKLELEAFNRKKMKEIIEKTELKLSLALNDCNEKLNETLKLFSGSEDLNQIKTLIKQNTIEMFEHKCKVKDTSFLSPYTKKLETDFDKIFANFLNYFNSKTEELKNFYKYTIDEAMNRCFLNIKTQFESKPLLSNDETITFSENLLKDVVHKYQNVPKHDKFEEIKDYVNERTASEAGKLLIERLTRFYAEKMVETLLTKTFLSREELSQINTENSERVIKDFHSHNKTSNSQLQELIVKLNDNLKVVFNKYYLQNEKNRENYVKEAINVADRLLNNMKKSGNLYENFIIESISSYAELMEEIFKDNTSISEEELENLHQTIVKEVLSEFENNFKNKDEFSVIESNRRVLEIEFMNEFKSIKKTNRMRNEMKLRIKDFVNEYEERMDKMIPFCGNKSEFLEQHLEIKNIIKQNMIDSNPMSNPKTLEPYITQFEAEINKSFIDFNLILKVNFDNQFLSLQNVIMNARKFYRDEMQKYYADANFLMLEKLALFNSSVTERTIAKYRSERGNMSIEKFDNTIKDSLKDIYHNFVEENDKNTPTLPSIGIDLGTTNSSVAFYEPSKPYGRTIIIPNDLGNRTTPSVVAFGDNNEEIIGEAAKEQSYRNSRNTIYSAKRLIGRQFDDEKVQKNMPLWPFKVVDDGNNIAKISIKVDGNDKVFFPEEISAKILKKLKQTAEIHLGFDVKNAVITVPAYFNEAQKEATKEAGKIAGLNVLKIINEPMAAAIAFQLNRSDELNSRKVLIFDFGGGTLDLAVLAIERGVIDIKAVVGDNHLGGDDIDAKLVHFCLKDFSTKTQIIINRASEEGQNALRKLTTECEKQKRQLCSKNSVQIIVDHFYYNEDLRCELTREKFEELNNDIFVKSTDLVLKLLSNANLDHSDIDDVVLVGGTTRIPKIQELLSDLFYGKPLNHSVNPDEAVAVGAAIQAAILNGMLSQSNTVKPPYL